MRLVLASALIVGTLVASPAYPWTDTRATCRAQCGLVQQTLEGWNDDQQATESWSWFRKTCGQRGDRGYRRCKRQLIRRCRIDGASSACPEVTTTTTSTTSTTTVRVSTTTTTIRRTTTTTQPERDLIGVYSLRGHLEYDTCRRYLSSVPGYAVVPARIDRQSGS